jgi:hypothetical protein
MTEDKNPADTWQVEGLPHEMVNRYSSEVQTVVFYESVLEGKNPADEEIEMSEVIQVHNKN